MDEMSTEPQRYDLVTEDDEGDVCEGRMETDDDGQYVLFSDWEALKAERDELASRNALFHDRIDALTKENETQREDLREKSRQLGRAMNCEPIFDP